MILKRMVILSDSGRGQAWNCNCNPQVHTQENVVDFQDSVAYGKGCFLRAFRGIVLSLEGAKP